MDLMPSLFAANLHLLECRFVLFFLDSWALAHTLYGRIIYGSLAWALCAGIATYFGSLSTEAVILLVSPAYLGIVGVALWMMRQLRTNN